MADQDGPGGRADYVAFRELASRWMDNDVYGHLNNVVYYSLFDTAVNAHLIDEGVLDIAAGAVIGLVVETGCRYFAPAAFPDVLHAGLRVAHMGRTSVRYEVGLFRNGEDRACAEGRFVHVYVDRSTRRPVPLPDALRAVLSRLAAPAAS